MFLRSMKHNLRILKESNLVVDERRGQEVFYTVNTEHTLKLLQSLVKDIQNKKK